MLVKALRANQAAKQIFIDAPIFDGEMAAPAAHVIIAPSRRAFRLRVLIDGQVQAVPIFFQ
jgi:hypothetical protein